MSWTIEKIAGALTIFNPIRQLSTTELPRHNKDLAQKPHFASQNNPRYPPCARSSSRADEKELQQVSELGSALTYRGARAGRVGVLAAAFVAALPRVLIRQSIQKKCLRARPVRGSAQKKAG